METTTKKNGFATWSREKLLETASRGGKMAHACGRAHKYTSEKAKEAGRLGGLKISANKEWMSKIGKLGGKKSQQLKRELPPVLAPQNVDLNVPELDNV